MKSYLCKRVRDANQPNGEKIGPNKNLKALLTNDRKDKIIITILATF